MTEKAEKILKELKKRDKKALKNYIPNRGPEDLEFMSSEVPEPIHDDLNRMPAEPVGEQRIEEKPLHAKGQEEAGDDLG